jgi:flagellin
VIINHNLSSMNALHYLNINNKALQSALEHLSSGKRINSAADDAAGLAISQKMQGQIDGLDQATRNAQDGISLIQTAEGALNETQSILQRMRDLAVQAANDTNTQTDRQNIQQEINQLTSEINRIGNTTEFNTQKLLNGAKSAGTAPSPVTLAGLTFSFSPGAALNGYTLQLGTVADGTTENATIDTTNKTITIDGDFDDTDGNGQYSSASNIANAINAALSSAGFSQTVTVTGNATTASAGTTSSALTGGANGAPLQFQIGANENQGLTLDISDMRAAALGISSAAGGAGFTTSQVVTDGTNNTAIEYALDVTTAANAGAAITKIQAAIDRVSGERSKLGAVQNRLEHTINNLSTASENLTAAQSRITDVDMAKAMAEFTKENVLAQAAVSMLAQANQQPQMVLKLLG